MSFTVGRFCGLTVRDFKGSIGWGSQPSTLTVQLVPDPLTGDFAAPPPIGTPIYFQFYNYRFNGILQKFEENDSTDGAPTFTAYCTDPREILANTEVVIGSYAGGVGPVRNLINAYGFWESAGYGSSAATPAGMPWFKIAEALTLICNTPAYTTYGGPLTYRGVAYGLDLSEIPVPPGYYRLGGANINLMEAIQQVCEDSGCDFFVELVGFTIRVRTVSRVYQPPLGTIAAVAREALATGTLVSATDGLEARNEVTSAFLVGGDKTTLHLSQNIVSFWGYDLVGNPIMGTKQQHPDIDGTHDFMTLNAAGVADIVGSTGYPCNTVEMRCALGGLNQWSSYIAKYRPDLKDLVYSMYGKGVTDPKSEADIVNDTKEAVKRVTATDKLSKTQRLYEFVRGFASEYYGKQYLVQIPFVLSKTDPETLVVTNSQEPTQAGFLAEGAAALGLSPLNEDVFKDQDDRFLPFAYFPTAVGADTTRCNWSDTVIEQNQSVYTRVNMEQTIIPVRAAGLTVPAVLIRLSSALYDAPLDQFGEAAILNKALFDGNKDKMLRMDDRSPMGTTRASLYVQPAARTPTVVAVPLKSNIEVYGPWYVAGAPGKVKFEYDSSLTPWDYGSYAVMNFAGAARVVNAVTNAQVYESGSIEVAVPPAYSLGDTLQTGGPNMTNIGVQYGTGGVTTTYRFETFTPRFGQFARANAERMKRMALGQVELRRTLRKALNKAVVAAKTVEAAFVGMLDRMPKFAKRESPGTVLVGMAVEANHGDGSILVGAGASTYTEALTMVLPDKKEHTDIAVMSLSGLVRPFTTSPTGNLIGNDYLPKFTKIDRTKGAIGTAPTGQTNVNVNALAADTYSPFRDGHDIEIVTNKNNYDGMHAYSRGTDPDRTRAFALRGPLVVAGWGYGIDGKQYPHGDDKDDEEFIDNALRRSNKWKVGPVDMLWDDQRGVWTSHDLVTAVTDEAIPGRDDTAVYPQKPESGKYVKVGGSDDWKIFVFNKFGSEIPEDTHVVCGYCLNENRWYVIAADCDG
jgi:hypothetical protein